MPKPESYILTTDFATLKNDAVGSTSVTAPGSVVIPAAGYVEYHADLSIGIQGSITRIQIASSKNSNIVQVTRNVNGVRFGIVLGVPGVPYTTNAFVYRLNPTTIRCQVYTPNPFADPLTTATGDEIFTFYINTFLPPYS